MPGPAFGIPLEFLDKCPLLFNESLALQEECLVKLFDKRFDCFDRDQAATRTSHHLHLDIPHVVIAVEHLEDIDRIPANGGAFFGELQGVHKGDHLPGTHRDGNRLDISAQSGFVHYVYRAFSLGCTFFFFGRVFPLVPLHILPRLDLWSPLPIEIPPRHSYSAALDTAVHVLCYKTTPSIHAIRKGMTELSVLSTWTLHYNCTWRRFSPCR